MANANKWEILFATFACCGIFAGFSGFVAFLFVLRNTQAGIWAFVSGIYAVTYLLLLILRIRGSIDQWYGTAHLFRLTIFGSLGIVASTVAFISYLALGIANHEGFPKMETVQWNHYIMAVWAALTLKWSITMTLFARSLSIQLRGGYQSI